GNLSLNAELSLQKVLDTSFLRRLVPNYVVDILYGLAIFSELLNILIDGYSRIPRFGQELLHF
ncbi:hypothetical protein JT05_09785, partial [Desulfosporosinus sp. Tol-M]